MTAHNPSIEEGWAVIDRPTVARFEFIHTLIDRPYSD